MTSVINLLKDKPRNWLQAGWTYADLFGCELSAVHGFFIQRCFAPQWGIDWLAADIGLQLVLDVVGLKGAHVLHLPTASVDCRGFADHFLALGFPGFKMILHGGFGLKRNRGMSWPNQRLSGDEWLDMVFDEGCASCRGQIHFLCRTCVLGHFLHPLWRRIPRLEAISELSAGLEGCIVGHFDVFRLTALGHFGRQALEIMSVCCEVLERLVTGFVLMRSFDKTHIHWVRDIMQLITGHSIERSIRQLGYI